MMIKIVKRILCKHENQSAITNFHGDAINAFGCRSWRRCNDCGKISKSEYLDKQCDRVNEWWYVGK